MLTAAIAGGVVIVATLCLHGILQVRNRRSGEPPLIQGSVPFLGLTLGLIFKGVTYWTSVKQPIFTVDFILFQVYVVQDPGWLRAIARNGDVQFYPFLELVYKVVADLRGPHLDALKNPPLGKGLAKRSVAAVERGLSSSNIGEVNIVALNSLSTLIEESVQHDATEVHLYDWVRHLVGYATSEAVYGPRHILCDRAIEDAFWDIEESGPLLFTGPLRDIIGKKALRCREMIAEAMKRYYGEGGLADASLLARSRHQLPKEEGFCDLEIGRMEVPFLFGILAGTPGATFWVLANILSRPELLTKIRSEVEEIVIIGGTSEECDTPTFTINIQSLKQSCPLLFSVYQETLRERSTFSTLRWVVTDTQSTVGTTTYRLRRNGVVILPPHAVHHSHAVWGANANVFDPERFIKTGDRDAVAKVEGKETKISSGRDPWRFRPFGGAPAICPGRHFATTEVMAVVSMLLVRFDIVPLDSVGWQGLKQNVWRVQGIAAPMTDKRVRMSERSAWKGTWTFKLGADTMTWPLSSG